MQLLAPTLRALLSLAALGAIAYGTSAQFNPPIAFIVIGGLVWWDLRDEGKPE